MLKAALFPTADMIAIACFITAGQTFGLAVAVRLHEASLMIPASASDVAGPFCGSG